MMNEQEIKELIEQTVLDSDMSDIAERIQYIMDFGKVYIQYDYCLN